MSGAGEDPTYAGGATPQDAVAGARADLAELRAAGRYAEPADGLVVEPLDQVSRAQLLEWALLEPDMTKLRSTRRLGGPITAVKRLQHRALRQFFNELTMQQTRFNIHVLRKLLELEDRIEKLEIGSGDPPAPDTAARHRDASPPAGSGTPR